jgi:hypothetical protein
MAYTADETPVPLDSTSQGQQQEAHMNVDLSRDMDEVYDLHFNLKDPRFIVCFLSLRLNRIFPIFVEPIQWTLKYASATHSMDFRRYGLRFVLFLNLLLTISF